MKKITLAGLVVIVMVAIFAPVVLSFNTERGCRIQV